MSTRPKVRKVILISGEGKADRNFLLYLKKLYCARDSDPVIKVHQNDSPGHSGGSSIEVIKEVMKACCNQGRQYDSFVAILDSDICTCTNQRDLYSEAKKELPKSYRPRVPTKYKFILLEPCLEGLILDIINSSHPQTSAQCKQAFKDIMNFEAHKIPESCYQKNLPGELIYKRKKDIPSLKDLYQLFHLSTAANYDSWFKK